LAFFVPTGNQPFTVSMVAERTGLFSGQNAILAVSNSVQMLFGPGPNLVNMYASGTQPTAPQTDSAFHAMQFIVNGASSSFYIDGTSTSAATLTGVGAITSGIFSFGVGGTGNNLVGNISEGGWWLSTFTGPQQTAMNANQHSYWGF
jgi:hypothetical protein